MKTYKIFINGKQLFESTEQSFIATVFGKLSGSAFNGVNARERFDAYLKAISETQFQAPVELEANVQIWLDGHCVKSGRIGDGQQASAIDLALPVSVRYGTAQRQDFSEAVFRFAGNLMEQRVMTASGPTEVQVRMMFLPMVLTEVLGSSAASEEATDFVLSMLDANEILRYQTVQADTDIGRICRMRFADDDFGYMLMWDRPSDFNVYLPTEQGIHCIKCRGYAQTLSELVRGVEFV